MIQQNDAIKWYKNDTMNGTVEWYNKMIQSNDTIKWYNKMIQEMDTIKWHHWMIQ